MCWRVELSGALLVAFLAGAQGCTGGQPRAAPVAGDAMRLEDTIAEPRARRLFLAAAAPAEDAFPHERHVGLECARCHATVPGHDTHGSVDCSACHGPVSAGPVATDAAERDCTSCHHAPAPQVGCAHCHEDLASPPDRLVTVRARFSTSGVVVRRLPFRHAAHTPVECARCHGADVSAPVGRACAGCHDRHHAPAASCSGCHPAPASGVHDADSHGGCSNAGCHDDPAVDRLPLTRPVCLACHRDQAGHEVGAECSSCHLVRSPGPTRAQESSR